MFGDHEVVTVVEAAGWSDAKNGELLQLAATRFDVGLGPARGGYSGNRGADQERLMG